MTCKYCAFTAQKSTFGNHEEVCELQPQICRYCEQKFKIEVYADHEEQCGGRTYKCDECSRFVCMKDKEMHLTSGKCEENKAENKYKEQLEAQKAMDDLKKFQDEEAKRRAMSKEKREKREREEAEMQRQMENLNKQKQ